MTRFFFTLAALFAALLAANAPLRADDPLPQAGEIAATGSVQTLLPRHTGFVLSVENIIRHDGSKMPLDPPRPKTVLMTVPDTLHPGDRVIVFGKDLGVGKSLPARLLLPDTALPAPWKDADIGAVGVPGGAKYVGGTFTVTASGEDLFGAADSFHFVWQPLHGDGQIAARVVEYQRRDMWTKVGVMVRETTDPGAKCADILVTPDKGAEFQRRLGTNGDTQTTDQVPSPTPFWVKLTRVGETLIGYVSEDGQTWQERGRDTLPMNADVLIGLCVTSHKNDTLTEAKIDSVRVGQ